MVRYFRYIALSLLGALLVLLAACTTHQPALSSPHEGQDGTSVEPTMPIGSMPSATPQASVETYLRHATDAYYSLDATLVAPYITYQQWVREDAYIQLKFLENRSLEMRLLSFSVVTPSVVPTDTVSTQLDTREQWKWRYWDLGTQGPATSWADTWYTMRYTLARQGSGWLVDGTQVVEESGDSTPTPLP